ncbi:MAG: hypothetical protein A7316_06980 [Candidatus Altiarchaeales archaeon WOR_SM1_86-2]|nr:MAG: hypothetical protein A7316_06980 [Candidatus Altiarchaeales archaeon WOR_SM1_86-2]
MDEDKVKKDGIKLIEEFSRMLMGVDEVEETHYVVDLKNVTRKGKKSAKKDFRERLKGLAPRWKDNYLVAEKGI